MKSNGKRRHVLRALFLSIVTCSASARKSPTPPIPEGEFHDKENTKQGDLGPDVLPNMAESSSLLSRTLLMLLHSALPTLARGHQWLLLYSSKRDGTSLLTLYRSSSTASGHCVLVVRDSQGAVFGALVTAPLRPSTIKKYQGDFHTFVFTTVSGTPRVFRSTGANRYYVFCTHEALALGGGGHFALYLDADLQNGSSGESETFGNTCLANKEDFRLKDIELWGFGAETATAPTLY